MNNKTLGFLLVSVVAFVLLATIQPTSAYVWGDDFEITFSDNYPQINFLQANTTTTYHFKAVSLFQVYPDDSGSGSDASNSSTSSTTPSFSASLSGTPSFSASLSGTPSFSTSLSPSASGGASNSVSPTLSNSASPTISDSSSLTISNSASATISDSASPSLSGSDSASPLASVSVSGSPSSSAEAPDDLEDLKRKQIRSVTDDHDDDHELNPDESTRVNFSNLQWALTTDYNFDPVYYHFNFTGTINGDNDDPKQFSSIVFAFSAPRNDTSYVSFDVYINDYKWVNNDNDDTKLVIAYVFWNERGNATLDNLVPNTNSVQINNGFFNISTTGSLVDDDNEAKSIDIGYYDGKESHFDGEIWVTFDKFSKGTVVNNNLALGLTNKKFDWKSKWWIVLVVVGAFLVVGALIYVGLYIHKRRKARYEEMV